MSQENCWRPRRAGANYGPTPPPRDPLLNIPLSLKRKELIMDFKRANKRGQSSDKWLHRLFLFLNGQDEQILIEDVRRWVENHSWISSPGGQPPEALKVRNQDDAPSTSTTPKKKISSSANQVSPPENVKKVLFKTPLVEVRFISPRPSLVSDGEPHKPPTLKTGPKVKLPKPSTGYFSLNKKKLQKST